MAIISLTLTKHKQMSPIENVQIGWSSYGIRVAKLKKLLYDGVNELSAEESHIWEYVKDKQGWLYCFVGHMDNLKTIKECYSALTETRIVRLKHYCLHKENIDSTRSLQGRDIKLDFGKVVDQTIQTRMKQHFDDDDYLEHYRRDAKVYFPIEINPYKEYNMDDFVDTLETILIKGNVDSTYNRLGVCNKMKTDNPGLHYPIKKVTNSGGLLAIEREIKINIK